MNLNFKSNYLQIGSIEEINKKNIYLVVYIGQLQTISQGDQIVQKTYITANFGQDNIKT